MRENFLHYDPTKSVFYNSKLFLNFIKIETKLKNHHFESGHETCTQLAFWLSKQIAKYTPTVNFMFGDVSTQLGYDLIYSSSTGGRKNNFKFGVPALIFHHFRSNFASKRQILIKKIVSGPPPGTKEQWEEYQKKQKAANDAAAACFKKFWKILNLQKSVQITRFKLKIFNHLFCFICCFKKCLMVSNLLL